jgi:hypothetical protein
MGRALKRIAAEYLFTKPRPSIAPSVRQCASRMWAINHAERVAGTAERTTALAEASSVS